jgi:hypothetical protein
MTNTLQLQRRLRRLMPSVIIVLGLLLISVLIIQQVAAQDSSTLKPPFKLHPADSAAAVRPQGLITLPLSAPIIMSQTFNSTYNPTTNPSTLGWHESYADGATSQYTWGYVNSAPLADTVWSVRHNPSGFPQLNPATNPYTKGMQALLIYGPLNLADYSQLVMTGTYWLDTAAGDDGDYFGVFYSTDGTNWFEKRRDYASDPSLTQMNTFHVGLGELGRKQVAWIALTFVSDDDAQVARGAFVKDVMLRGVPVTKIHMPLVRYDPTPTPTATPQASYVYNYTFGTGQGSDPQFAEWGGKVDDAGCHSADSAGCKWGQDIITSGNPSGAMNMYQTGLDSIAGASPNNTAPTNYELSADFYVIQGKSDARLGLIFGAGDKAFGRSGGAPTFDPDSNLFKFDLQFNENDNTVLSYYRLQRCTNNINGCTNLVEKSTLTGGLVGNTGTWNTIKIQRLGNNIKVYVNNALLANVDDSNNLGAKKYGIFLQTKRLNNASNPIKIRFDNVRVRPLP